MIIGKKSVIAVLFLILPAASNAEWIVTELPMLDGWAGDSELFDINNSGVACGTGNYVSGSSGLAIRFDGVNVTVLPPLAPGISYAYSTAHAINDSGVVAGWSHNAEEEDRAVIWIDTAITEIPVPPDQDPTKDMRAYGINNDNDAVGYYVSTNGYAAAFYYDYSADVTYSLRAALRGVGLTGERSYATDINNNGMICGYAEDGYSDYIFFTYDTVSQVATAISGLSPYPGVGSYAEAINDSGHIVGRTKTLPWDPINHAVIYDGEFHIIDESVTVTQWARDISNKGRAVGRTGSGDATYPWYSDSCASGSMVRVDLDGWTRANFGAVNDNYLMVGSGRTAESGEDERAFILSPPHGDANHDGTVDLDDYQTFADCFSGQTQWAAFTPPSEACLAAFDASPADGDIDLEDFAAFQAAFEGN